jgi:hypothetical protein
MIAFETLPTCVGSTDRLTTDHCLDNQRTIQSDSHHYSGLCLCLDLRRYCTYGLFYNTAMFECMDTLLLSC